MKNFKYSCVFIVFLLIVSNGYAKGNNIWNDVTQDSIQINSPVEFIDNYGKYTVISSKVKIKLSDFGNIDKNKNGIKYTLKNYGVQVLNGDKVYNVFKTTVPVKSNVDFNLLYHDTNIVAFRVRENSTIDYVKKPFKNFIVNAYVYNLKTNKFSTLPVLNSESELEESKLDLLQGDQIIFNAKKGIYTYLANIKYAKNGKLGVFEVNLNKSLKCISASQGCENVGLSSAEIDISSK